MTGKRLVSRHLFFKTRTVTTSAALPLDPTVSSIPTDRFSLCLAFTDQLINRGLLSSAQKLFQRIISQSSSVSDALSALHFVTAQGLDLDLSSFVALIKKLEQSGHHQLAYSLYSDCIIGRGIIPDTSIANSIVICLCKLGKLEEATVLFDRLITDGSCGKPAFNALVRLLFSHERFLDAFDYFVKMNNINVNLGNRSYEVLIDGLCQKGYLQEAVEMFGLMPERTGLLPTLCLYKSLFYGLCKQGWVMEAESLFGEMESLGFFVDKTMYTSLMNVYCKDRKMKMAMRVYLRMLKTGCELDRYTYNTLIHGFVKMGLFDQGWALYNQMVKHGLQPCVVTYHVMISNYCREGKVDCASMLLNSMISNNLAPNVHSYTVLITSLYKENRVMEAEELYKSMLSGGLVPDHVLFFKLMKMYPKGYELRIAFMILKAIALNGCGLDPLLLPVSAHEDLDQKIEFLIDEILKSDLRLVSVAFNILISALCEESKLDSALHFMEKMMNLGCTLLLFTYNSLVKCLSQKGLFEDAKSLLDFLRDQGIFPDQATYLIRINEHCKRGDLAPALDILNQMEDRGMKPSVSIYDCIIGSLCRQKRMFEAENMFIRMLESGVNPDEVVYMKMINGYSMTGRVIEAHQLFDKMIEDAIRPTSYSYTALISGLVKKDMTDKGCMYLDKMLNDGLVPNAVLYTSLIHTFLQKGEFEFAFRLVDLMDRNQIERDFISYVTLVSGFCRSITRRKRWRSTGRRSERAREMLFQLLHRQSLLPREKKLRVSDDSPEAMKHFALKLIQKVKQTKFMPNLYLYNGIIYGFIETDRMKDAYDHLELMQKEGVHPNQVTFTVLMGGHIKAGEIDHAVGLYNKMNADGCAPDRVVYHILVKGLCQAGRLLEALSILHAMYKRRLIPSKGLYEILLGYFCANYLGIPAFKIFEEMLVYHPNPRLYHHNWLLCILCEQQILREAYIVFGTMIERGKVVAVLNLHFVSSVFVLCNGVDFQPCKWISAPEASEGWTDRVFTCIMYSKYHGRCTFIMFTEGLASRVADTMSKMAFNELPGLHQIADPPAKISGLIMEDNLGLTYAGIPLAVLLCNSLALELNFE
ncbi:NAC domain-containing protein 7-like [Hibiscus syriacus]|uniref:NAC domain-containing protein 7-like n=1 Tax=Hibiscus syriacus TaxID=106335 RepID=A0A6A2XFL2_HIBSY|nr:NAC domain-containing protein 7-like [Hibiscus syriacus]